MCLCVEEPFLFPVSFSLSTLFFSIAHFSQRFFTQVFLIYNMFVYIVLQLFFQLSLGFLWCWLSEHTRSLCWFFILYTSAVDFISLSCELCEILLKICRSILAQCQTTLPVAFVLLETNLCGRCISEATLLYFFLPGFTIFDFRNHSVTGILHKHLAQNSLSKES